MRRDHDSTAAKISGECLRIVRQLACSTAVRSFAKLLWKLALIFCLGTGDVEWVSHKPGQRNTVSVDVAIIGIRVLLVVFTRATLC